MTSRLFLSRLTILILLIFSANAAVYASSSKYTSKLTVSATGSGKVYAEKQGNLTVTTTADITETTQTVQQGEDDLSYHFYTLYANPDDGYAFKEWTNNSTSGVEVMGVEYTQE